MVFLYARGMCLPCDRVETPEKHGLAEQKPRAKIKPISDKQAAMLREYRKLRDEYMKHHPNCAKCGVEATDLHHMRGRSGDNLTDVDNFLALCRPCHTWVELHPEEAKKLNLSKNRI